MCKLIPPIQCQFCFQQRVLKIFIFNVSIFFKPPTKISQSLRHGFEVFYLDNIVGPCYRWVWVLECWMASWHMYLLEVVGNFWSEVILFWGQRLPEIVWEVVSSKPNTTCRQGRVTNFYVILKNIIWKFWIFIIFGISVLCSVQTVHATLLLHVVFRL